MPGCCGGRAGLTARATVWAARWAGGEALPLLRTSRFSAQDSGLVLSSSVTWYAVGWSVAGWTWLAGRDATALPAACVDAEPDQPRVCITWYEAEAYAAWRGGALPTEAQWEYAARGPSSSIFPWGEDWDASKANVVDSKALTSVDTHPDGASWVGAVDMAGNAMEWVADWYSAAYYRQEVRDDPTGPE
jgi:formylglycine-generating enzyme required for sulfatase activity